MKKQQEKQADQYYKGAKNLPCLGEGDVVRLKPYMLSGKVWNKAIVTKRLDDRSYEICSEDGNIYRRNRADLRKSNELSPFEDNTRQLELAKPHSAKTVCQETMKDKTENMNDKIRKPQSIQADHLRITNRSGR